MKIIIKNENFKDKQNIPNFHILGIPEGGIKKASNHIRNKILEKFIKIKLKKV